MDCANVLAAIVEEQFHRDAFDPEALENAFRGSGRRILEAQIYNHLKTQVEMGAYVTDADGRLLFDSRPGRPDGEDLRGMRDVVLTLNGNYGARSSRTNQADDNSSVMFVGAPIHDTSGNIIGCLSVFKPQASMFAFIQETKDLIKVLGLAIAGAAALTCLLIAAWISRPIERLTNHARAIRRGERPPPPKVGSSEVGTLGRAFEEMRDALEGRDYVEGYVQSLTHEMKSPVAAIRGAAELLEDPQMSGENREKFLSNIRFESDRLQHLIDRLLALSALESKKHLESPEEIDLCKLTDAVIADHQAGLAPKGLRIERNFQSIPRSWGNRF